MLSIAKSNRERGFVKEELKENWGEASPRMCTILTSMPQIQRSDCNLQTCVPLYHWPLVIYQAKNNLVACKLMQRVEAHFVNKDPYREVY